MKTHAGINQGTYVTSCRRYAQENLMSLRCVMGSGLWPEYGRTGSSCVLLTGGGLAWSNSRFRTNTPDRTLHKSLSLSWWVELEGRRRFAALMLPLKGKTAQGLVLQAGTGLSGGHDVCNYVILVAFLWDLQVGQDDLLITCKSAKNKKEQRNLCRKLRQTVSNLCISSYIHAFNIFFLTVVKAKVFEGVAILPPPALESHSSHQERI